MAIVLFITDKDIKVQTSINGNIDVDKIKPIVKSVQDIEVQPLIGTRLMEKLENDISGGTLAEPYTSLLNDYIKPVLCWFAAADYIIVGSINVSNGGIYRHEADSGTSLSNSEMLSLSDRYKNKGEFYSRRLLDHLQVNSSTYPEFNQWQSGDMPKQSTAYRVNMLL